MEPGPLEEQGKGAVLLGGRRCLFINRVVVSGRFSDRDFVDRLSDVDCLSRVIFLRETGLLHHRSVPARVFGTGAAQTGISGAMAISRDLWDGVGDIGNDYRLSDLSRQSLESLL